MTDLADLSIADAGAGLRSGDFNAVELTDAALTRAAITESHLHAYLTLDQDRARAACDSHRRGHAKGILQFPVHA